MLIESNLNPAVVVESSGIEPSLQAGKPITPPFGLPSLTAPVNLSLGYHQFSLPATPFVPFFNVVLRLSQEKPKWFWEKCPHCNQELKCEVKPGEKCPKGCGAVREYVESLSI